MSGQINSLKQIDLQAYEGLQEKYLEDIGAYGFVLRHKKTGARICVISCEDDNKVFFTAFRTSPDDNTGVAHIVEHTVLCGSDRYPVKDPFMEVSKSSLNTFMNAFTYPDKTMYPVASCNDKDFKNIMGVYLDAVFHPLIYKNKNVFLQEGWRYELESIDSPLTINGVVYSEMKGVYSSPDEILQTAIMNELFPDTTYRVDSGGVPEFIPDLTYEQYLEFHRTHYHPSNSYIFLYGNMDVAERLDYIDREYLSAYDALPEVVKATQIASQKEFLGAKKASVPYNVSADEDIDNAYFLSDSFKICDADDQEKVVAFQMLRQALFDAPGAPVKQALIDAGIGDDIDTAYFDYIKQPAFSVIARNAGKDQMEDFLRILKEELTRQVENGIDEKSLLAAINHEEFSYREADFGHYPKGLVYGMAVMNTWLHYEDMVFESIEMGGIYKKLKDNVGTGYFENLVKECLLESKHELHLIMEPKQGLLEESEAELKARLEQIRLGMSEEERQRVLDELEELHRFQDSEDTEEALATIPRLSLSDVERTTKPIEYSVENVEGATCIFTPAKTSGIAYFTFDFDISCADRETAQFASLLSAVLGNISTSKHSYLELSNEINIYSGGIGTSTHCYEKNGDPDFYRPMYAVMGKFLYPDAEKSLELAHELMMESKLDDRKRLKEILAQTRSQLQNMIASQGHVIALRRAMSYVSQGGKFKEYSGGLSYYRFIEELSRSFEERPETVTEKLSEFVDRVFRSDRLIIHLTADVEAKEELLKAFGAFVKKLPKGDGNFEKQGMQFELTPLNEGLTTAGMVQYVVAAGNYLKAGFKHTGRLSVLRQILDNGYLYENIRVHGGAYGAFAGFSNVDGQAYFMSYRDPKLAETLEVMKSVGDYLRSFEASADEMKDHIIGTLGSIDSPMSPAAKGSRAYAAYMAGLDEEELQKRRDDILSTTAEDIRALAGIADAAAHGSLCVVGGEKQIEENKELFGRIESCRKKENAHADGEL